MRIIKIQYLFTSQFIIAIVFCSSIAHLFAQDTILMDTVSIGEKMANFHKVSPELYRSAQPSKDAVSEINEVGIRTVLNLRSVAGNKKFKKEKEILFIQKRINTWVISEQDMLESFVLFEQNQKPFLVHCKHGADRTGAFVAFYRIIYQNWSKEKAIQELREGGFGFHEQYFGNIITLINLVDFEGFKNNLQIELKKIH